MVQSMITCDTMDTAACIQQTLDLAEVGCQLVRITAPTVKDAANLKNIVQELRSRGCFVPIAADIHFKPEAAMEAALWVEKIRINPGNFADTKKFESKEYTEESYQAELRRIEEKFTPLVLLCKKLGRAMRIGTNHGSLSDRILNRFGDTPQGMVESALEFATIAHKLGYHDLVFSMKASNPKVMIESYRLIAARLEEMGPDWNYPLHLGVTEAGEGEDGRIKSAIGIGSLLADGLGDTIRVSLTEDSPHEIPVCFDLIKQVCSLTDESAYSGTTASATHPLPTEPPYDPFHWQRRESSLLVQPSGMRCGASETIRVCVDGASGQQLVSDIKPMEDVRPEMVIEDVVVQELNPLEDITAINPNALATVKDNTPLPPIAAFRLLAYKLAQIGCSNPILLKDSINPGSKPLESKLAMLESSVVLGSLLADGIGDVIWIRRETDARKALQLSYNILQAVGCRSFKTDYVACPSCGRTLFNLQTVTARIKARTLHLKGVKIAIMGCIVNGPGEMADADFGYVGGAPGKVNLYVGKKPQKFNIPEAEAVDRLVDLIKEHGKWVEPA